MQNLCMPVTFTSYAYVYSWNEGLTEEAANVAVITVYRSAVKNWLKTDDTNERKKMNKLESRNTDRKILKEQK